VLPFFCHLERDADCVDAWHGRRGPLPIQRAPYADLPPVQRAFLEACTAAGYPAVADHNAPGAVGAGPVPKNAHDGVRQSTALTYLAPARPRANLTVRSGVLVDRVLFEGRRAVGIRAVDPAETFYGERIILAAGAYGSPAILLRSGVGPADQLRRLGIGVQEPLVGVGWHLIDHPIYRLRLAASRVPQTADGPSWQTVLTWRSTQGTVGHDVQILPRSLALASPAESPSGAAFLLMASLVKPRSHGRVWLRSASPAVAPHIDPGYFTHPDDLPRLCEAVRIAQRLAQTPPLSNWVIRAWSPGLQGDATDAGLGATIRAEVGTYHHPVGTCRMGPATDAAAVVDSHGNVHGVEGLSVIDASIMPTIPAANTNVPTIMVAERCVAWLKEHV
jgi:choline dehydrogenase